MVTPARARSLGRVALLGALVATACSGSATNALTGSPDAGSLDDAASDGAATGADAGGCPITSNECIDCGNGDCAALRDACLADGTCFAASLKGPACICGAQKGQGGDVATCLATWAGASPKAGPALQCLSAHCASLCGI